VREAFENLTPNEIELAIASLKALWKDLGKSMSALRPTLAPMLAAPEQTDTQGPRLVARYREQVLQRDESASWLSVG